MSFATLSFDERNSGLSFAMISFASMNGIQLRLLQHFAFFDEQNSGLSFAHFLLL